MGKDWCITQFSWCFWWASRFQEMLRSNDDQSAWVVLRFFLVLKWKQIDYNMYYDSHTYPWPLEANLSGHFLSPICESNLQWDIPLEPQSVCFRGSDHHWLGKKRCSQEGAQRRAGPSDRMGIACMAPPSIRGFSYETKGLESNISTVMIEE